MAISFDKTLGTKTENAAALTMTLTTAAAAVSGSRVFLIVEWAGNALVAAVSNGGVNNALTWNIDVQRRGAVNSCAIISADAPNGLASGTVITVTFSVSCTHGLIAALSAVGSTLIPDSEPQSVIQGAVTAWTITGNTVNANTFVLGASAADSTATSTITNGTEVHDFSDGSFFGAMTTAYRIESSSGAKQINGTWTAAPTGMANLWVAYKELVVPPALVVPDYTQFPKPLLRKNGNGIYA